MLDAAFRGSKRYWSILAVWMALIVIGGITFTRQMTEGLTLYETKYIHSLILRIFSIKEQNLLF